MMENELNNRFLNTVSNKLNKASFVIKHIHTKMLESQRVRRYVYYNTQNPLSKRGIDYQNNKVDQPDVTESQVKDLITALPFSREMAVEVENKIFINLPVGNFANKNELIIDVSIITPVEYYETTEGYRNYQIACEIANEVADKYVDGEYINDLGDGMKIALVNAGVERLSKTNTCMCTTLVFRVSQPTPFERVRV